MRRLIVYRQDESVATVQQDLGRLAFVIAAAVTVTSATVVIRFTYNYIDYALVCKLSSETWDETLVLSLGLNSDTVAIVVDANSLGFIPLTVAYDLAKATGTIIDVNALAGFALIITLLADQVSTAKVFAVTSSDATYVSGISDSTVEIDVEEITTTESDPIELDIDEQSAIGLTFKSFDIRNPNNIGVSHSNAFTLPRTPKNEQVHGFEAANDDVYSRWLVDYINDNEYIIKDGRFMVESVGERITCSIFGRDSGWDIMAKTSWSDFMQLYVDWLTDNHTTVYTDYATMISTLAAATTHVKLAGYYGDLYTLSDRKQAITESGSSLILGYSGLNGGHFCTHSKSIFEAIKDIYGVDFTGGDDSIFLTVNSYFQNRNIDFRIDGTSQAVIEYSRGWVNTNDGTIELDKEGLTVVDFIRSFMLSHGVILDRIDERTYTMQAIEALDTAPIYDLSGLSADEPIEFMPLLDGVGQQSVIDFTSYAESIPVGSVAKVLTCNNRNAEAKTNYIKIDAHIPAGYVNENYIMLGLFDSGSRSKFTFLVDSDISDSLTFVRWEGFSSQGVAATVAIASILPIPYDIWEGIIDKPKAYKVKKWLNPVDIKNLKFFQRYWVEELRGNFYLSAVNGFNPEGSLSPTELELILINRTIELIVTVTWGDFVCELVDSS
jgi:hypothetical protein